MNRIFLVLLMIVSVVLVPLTLQADQSMKNRASSETLSRQDGAGATDMDADSKSRTGRKMVGQDDRQAQHKQYQQKLETMNQRLDQKTAAMNSAKGDQKLAAMSEVVNELVAQRHEFENWFRTMHGRKMHHAGMGRMGSKAHGGGMKGCPGMGMSGGMGGPAQGSSDTGSGDLETAEMQHDH